MKDNFSAQASDYSKFRPTYPQEMIDYILSFVSQKRAALDVATGNGQVAVLLSPHFEEVFATDISQKQLDNAGHRPNITYRLESAENTKFSDNQFDLITVAQAIHWFDFDKFYDEAKRILKPDGVIAVMGYGLFITNPESDKIILNFYESIIGPYWDAERKYIDDNYTTIPFPFDEQPGKAFNNAATWNFEQLAGYLETWSAVQHYKNANGTNPVEIIRDELKQSWENSNKQVTFPLLLRVGRKV